jgi:hypothetical protein
VSSASSPQAVTESPRLFLPERGAIARFLLQRRETTMLLWSSAKKMVVTRRRRGNLMSETGIFRHVNDLKSSISIEARDCPHDGALLNKAGLLSPLAVHTT